MKPFTNDQLRLIKHNWNGTNTRHMARILDMPEDMVEDKLNRLPANFLQIGLDYQEEQKQQQQEEQTRQVKEPKPHPRYLRSDVDGLAPKPDVVIKRPPAVYSNRNIRQELLDKYAPIKD